MIVNVSGKVVVVTGGGNGIGRELVLQLLREGASVAAVDIDEKGLKETEKHSGEFSGNLSIHKVDLSDQEAVHALSNKVQEIHKHVDAIINNAGIIQPFVHVNDLDYDRINLVMDVNFYGTLYMVKAFLPYLLKRPEAHITNVSSMGAYVPVPGQSIYGASKAAVKLMTEGLHSELKNTNVGVTIVFPGAVGTDIMKHSGAEGSRTPKEGEKEYKVLSADKAASLILKAMRKKKYRATVGGDARFMDILSRLSPKRAAKIIANKLG